MDVLQRYFQTHVACLYAILKAAFRKANTNTHAIKNPRLGWLDDFNSNNLKQDFLT